MVEVVAVVATSPSLEFEVTVDVGMVLINARAGGDGQRWPRGCVLSSTLRVVDRRHRLGLSWSFVSGVV